MFIRCTFRFPSTNIRVEFQSLVNEQEQNNVIRIASPPRQRAPLPPLKINIPTDNTVYSSPFPSPTGTISAANSCPASPRAGQGRRNVSADLQMVAVYAAQVASDPQSSTVERHDAAQSTSRQISPEPGPEPRFRGGGNGTTSMYFSLLSPLILVLFSDFLKIFLCGYDFSNYVH